MAHVVYELSFKGSASAPIRSAFADFEVVSGHGCTTLRAALDQAGLHGAIARIQELGLELLDVHLVAEANGGDAAVSWPDPDVTM